jgi:hypothetical protein
MGVPDIYNVSRIAEGRSLQRAVTASVLATLRGTTPEKILRQTWPRDEGAMLLVKAPVSPLKAADYVHFDQVGAFRSMAPGSAALKLFDASVKLDLTGLTTLSVPRFSALTAKPVFIAEAGPAPSLQLVTSGTVLGPAKKILVLSAVTKELDEATPETAVAVVGRALSDATSAAIDKTAFDTNASDSGRPAGMFYNVTPVTASSNTDKYMALADDLAALAGAIGAAGIDPNDVIYVAGPAEATKIKIRAPELSSNVLVTLGLPSKSVAAFAPAAVYSGYQDVPNIETAEEVVIHREDTTPAEIVTTPGVKAAPVSSFWQMYMIAIKVRAWAAWACAPGGAQIVNNVTW